jgi:hypothetical protein
MKQLIPQETIEQRIYLIRGQKVMLDHDLAELYGVQTKQLNRQVKRNILRFPPEFMFQLTPEEKKQLVPIWHHFKTRKHAYSLPYAFTEHGIWNLKPSIIDFVALKTTETSPSFTNLYAFLRLLSTNAPPPSKNNAALIGSGVAIGCPLVSWKLLKYTSLYAYE